ncbi:MAG: ABC transporter substrate-binding protein [Anaerolineae bacterium]|nr:ABC transporter substrate-binding protein [Anaerolineae bacterium]
MLRKTAVLVSLTALLVAPTMAFAQDDMVVMGDDIAEACPAPANLSGEIPVGALFTISGAASVYGSVQQAAVQMAVDQINEAGFLGDATINILFEDSASENEQAIAAMTKLVDEDAVVAVIGPTLSREAFSADPIAQEAGVVVLGVSNTASGITDMGDFVFRNSLPEASVIPGTVADTIAAAEITSAGLLYANDDDFTVSGFEVMADELANADVTIVGEETFATGDTDFNAQLTNLIGASPDAIFVSALAAEATPIIQQARALGFTGPIVGGNGFNSPAVLAQTGEDSNGLIVGAAWNGASPNELSNAFVEAFSEATGNPPDQFAAQAYTGAWLIASAIRCADSVDRTDIRDSLAALPEIDTPLGMFTFDEDRNPVHPSITQIAQDGFFVPLISEEVSSS